VAFTDGVTDARNSDKQGFGENRLLALIADPDPSAHDLIERIVANVRGHIGDAAQFDDITMVAVRRSA
jgi:serine phosphatase RsbU (regulator of sigma subunit)